MPKVKSSVRVLRTTYHITARLCLKSPDWCKGTTYHSNRQPTLFHIFHRAICDRPPLLRSKGYSSTHLGYII